MLSKGHVVYEGISGHILTYDRECSLARWVVFFLFFFLFGEGSAHRISVFSVFLVRRFVFSDS